MIADVDKLEMIVQALEYERGVLVCFSPQPPIPYRALHHFAAQGIDLSEFYASVRGKFHYKFTEQWYNEVCTRRPPSSSLRCEAATRPEAGAPGCATWAFVGGVAFGCAVGLLAAVLLRTK